MSAARTDERPSRRVVGRWWRVGRRCIRRAIAVVPRWRAGAGEAGVGRRDRWVRCVPTGRAALHTVGRLDAGGTFLEEPHVVPKALFLCVEDLTGRRYTRARDQWIARMPTADESSILELPTGAPVMHVIHIARDEDGDILEVSESIPGQPTASSSSTTTPSNRNPNNPPHPARSNRYSTPTPSTPTHQPRPPRIAAARGARSLSSCCRTICHAPSHDYHVALLPNSPLWDRAPRERGGPCPLALGLPTAFGRHRPVRRSRTLSGVDAQTASGGGAQASGIGCHPDHHRPRRSRANLPCGAKVVRPVGRSTLAPQGRPAPRCVGRRRTGWQGVGT
ncbi:MAG: UTRA domain-containing protein [Pseudonocardiaceae bacterium]